METPIKMRRNTLGVKLPRKTVRAAEREIEAILPIFYKIENSFTEYLFSENNFSYWQIYNFHLNEWQKAQKKCNFKYCYLVKNYFQKHYKPII